LALTPFFWPEGPGHLKQLRFVWQCSEKWPERCGIIYIYILYTYMYNKPWSLYLIVRYDSYIIWIHLIWYTKMQIHPGRLTWNLKITHLERKMIFQTSMSMFHVNLSGRTYCRSSYHMLILTVPPSQRSGVPPSGKHRSKRGARGAWGADHDFWKVLEDDSLLLIKGSRVGGEREPTEKGDGFKLKFLNSLPFFYVQPPPPKKKNGGNDPIWRAYFFQMGWIETTN